MTDAERKALVERMRLQIAKTQFGCKEPDDGDFEACVRRIQHIDGSNPCECWLAARAALSEAERVVREDEREGCLAIVAAWSRDGQSPTAHGIDEGIRARGAA